MRVRKRPVEVEAREFLVTFGEELARWCGGEFFPDPDGTWGSFINIPTLEGTHRADVGDWIVKGVEGEFYPVKPQIFWKTYERA